MTQGDSATLPSPRRREGVLMRYDDISEVSGTGIVAEVTEFSSGWVAVGWLGNNPSVAVWPNVDSVLAVHGHNGATVILWADGDQPEEDEACTGTGA